MIKIGITGSLGTGKSAVSNFFREKGHLVISADKINQKLLEKKEIVKDINSLLFKDDSKVLNKEKISKLIFFNSEKKKELESYLHPLIYNEMVRQIAKSDEKIVFLEIPLLYETNFQDLVNYVIVVYLDEDIQIKRVMKRDNILKDEAIMRVNSQMALREKVLKADYVIDNSGTIEETEKQLNHWYKNYLRRL